jgi:MFS family permease
MIYFSSVKILLEKIRNTRLKGLLFTSLGHFINDGESFLVPVVVAALVAQRGILPLDVTLMYLAFYLSSAVLSVYIGNVADRTGHPGPLIAVGLAIFPLGF